MLDLVLHVDGRDSALPLVNWSACQVGCCGTAAAGRVERPENHVRVNRRVGERNGQARAVDRLEEAVAATLPALLLADLEAEQQGLVDPGKPVFPDQVGLAEQVLAVGRVVVGRQLDRPGSRWRRCSGRRSGRICHSRQTACDCAASGPRRTDARSRSWRRARRPWHSSCPDRRKRSCRTRRAARSTVMRRCRRGSGWHAAVGGAAVVEIFVAEVDAGVPDRPGCRPSD